MLQAQTRLEWSGYGPLSQNGDGWVLHDFYYLSDGDTQASTDLGPEATAEAWQRSIEDGYPAERLAWVHCHPWGGGAWSAQDESAINDCVEWAREQVSVLFSRDDVVARYDTPKTTEDLKVIIEWGDLERDVSRAAKVQAQYKPPVTRVYVNKPWQPSNVVPNRTPKAKEKLKCTVCGKGDLCLHCDICELPFCVDHLHQIDQEGIICGGCIKLLDLDELVEFCPHCAISMKACDLCGTSVCDAHCRWIDSAGAILCPSCKKVMYGDD